MAPKDFCTLNEEGSLLTDCLVWLQRTHFPSAHNYNSGPQQSKFPLRKLAAKSAPYKAVNALKVMLHLSNSHPPWAWKVAIKCFPCRQRTAAWIHSVKMDSKGDTLSWWEKKKYQNTHRNFNMLYNPLLCICSAWSASFSLRGINKGDLILS